jgi:hypothetical protein
MAEYPGVYVEDSAALAAIETIVLTYEGFEIDANIKEPVET